MSSIKSRLDYASALAALGSRHSRKVAPNTYLVERPTYDGDGALVRSVAVLFHQTDIVRFYADGVVRLSSGGWQTYTTKDRLNTFCPWSIFQDKRVWYIALPGNPRTPFVDGMYINAEGKVV